MYYAGATILNHWSIPKTKSTEMNYHFTTCRLTEYLSPQCLLRERQLGKIFSVMSLVFMFHWIPWNDLSDENKWECGPAFLLMGKQWLHLAEFLVETGKFAKHWISTKTLPHYLLPCWTVVLGLSTRKTLSKGVESKSNIFLKSRCSRKHILFDDNNYSSVQWALSCTVLIWKL